MTGVRTLRLTTTKRLSRVYSGSRLTRVITTRIDTRRKDEPMTFHTYHDARNAAESLANRSGLDYSIHREPKLVAHAPDVWVVRSMPAPEKTFGIEATWERVRPEIVA